MQILLKHKKVVVCHMVFLIAYFLEYWFPKYLTILVKALHFIKWNPAIISTINSLFRCLIFSHKIYYWKETVKFS